MIFVFIRIPVETSSSLPVVIGFRSYANPFVIETVRPRRFLILWTHKVSYASLVHVRTAIQKEFYH